MTWLRQRTPSAERCYTLTGRIASVGFATGDRLVVGIWENGPLNAMNDIMWAHPDGTRTLIAPSERVAEFVSSLYTFERTRIAPVVVDSDDNSVRVSAGGLDLRFTLGRAIPIPFRRLRSPAITRRVEGPISQWLLGVRTYGKARNGVEEWYQADAVRRIVTATASVDGRNLGAMRNLLPALRVGFSEPPKWPSCVSVRPRLLDAHGVLDTVLRAE